MDTKKVKQECQTFVPRNKVEIVYCSGRYLIITETEMVETSQDWQFDELSEIELDRIASG